MDEDINDLDDKMNINKKGKRRKRKRKGKLSSINRKKLKSLDNDNSMDEYSSSYNENENNSMDEYKNLNNENNNLGECSNLNNNNENNYTDKIIEINDKNNYLNNSKPTHNENNNSINLDCKNEENKKDDSDEEFIPSSIDEIVEVKKSTIVNSGRGLFAKIFIPKYAVLGFYFGVPMTEWEFDSLKEGKGLSSNYSIRYRKTVLDATDENGQPYWNNPKIFCPFHFMNENINGKPNVEFREGNKVNQVLIVAISNILPGEEIFVDYGKEVDRTGWGSDKFNNYAENFSDGNPNVIKNNNNNENINLTKSKDTINGIDNENENSILQKIKDNKNEVNNNSQRNNETIKTDNSKLLLTLLLKISKDNRTKSENDIEVDRFEELKKLLKNINYCNTKPKEEIKDKINKENQILNIYDNTIKNEEPKINNSNNINNCSNYENYKNLKNLSNKDIVVVNNDNNLNQNNIDNIIQKKSNKRKYTRSKSRSKNNIENNNNNNNTFISKTNSINNSVPSSYDLENNNIKRRKRGRPSVKKSLDNEINKNNNPIIENIENGKDLCLLPKEYNFVKITNKELLNNEIKNTIVVDSNPLNYSKSLTNNINNNKQKKRGRPSIKKSIINETINKDNSDINNKNNSDIKNNKLLNIFSEKVSVFNTNSNNVLKKENMNKNNEILRNSNKNINNSLKEININNDKYSTEIPKDTNNLINDVDCIITNNINNNDSNKNKCYQSISKKITNNEMNINNIDINTNCTDIHVKRKRGRPKKIKNVGVNNTNDSQKSQNQKLLHDNIETKNIIIY
eukprot:jgi/Orpsp1_1/1180003/evm.model.c7180000071753.1